MLQDRMSFSSSAVFEEIFGGGGEDTGPEGSTVPVWFPVAFTIVAKSIVEGRRKNLPSKSPEHLLP